MCMVNELFMTPNGSAWDSRRFRNLRASASSTTWCGFRRQQ